ncbi:hypothetical protein EJ077_09105 [Mesorhizobium sp. M8A.F.Ca.ET.057.01.1.1]|nr:hypothetical protein EJ077_09105 [Mesorhizobium sp. M8A.F.Ca.ET.057.01.1.1]RWE46200.1 MAG: hypothetical protein EOS80_16355 [Mesorhizobium sp.]
MTAFIVGAAPHLPAGILSPYSDGEREAVVSVAKKRAPLRQPLSPRLRGEMSGRTVRGSADGDRHAR